MAASVGNGQTNGLVILVAEDDEDDRFLLRRAYASARLPHSLQFVTNGEEAVDYVAGNARFSDRTTYPAPSLLLLDIKMPRMTGFQVLEWLKANGHDHIPAIMLTGSNLPRDEDRAKDLGALAFIVKTPDHVITIEILREVCPKLLAPAH